jgi:subtilase family serine protease
MKRFLLISCIVVLLTGVVGQAAKNAEAVTLAQSVTPDLRVTAATVTVPDAANPAQVRVEITVSNEGTAPAPAFTIRWYPHIYQLDIVGCSFDVPGLNVNARGTARCFYTYPGGDTGEIYSLVLADPDDEIEELKETNNKLAGLVNIVPAGPPPPSSGDKPDLKITRFDVTPNLVPGEPGTVRLFMEVTNDTDVPVGPFSVRWFPHENSDVTGWAVDVPKIDPHSYYPSDGAYTYPQNGEMHWAAAIDADNEILESDEDNNQARGTVVIGASGGVGSGVKPDLIIQDAHFEPAQATQGQTFKAVMVVKNDSSVLAGRFSAQWHFHASLGLQDCNWDIAQGMGPGTALKLTCTRTTNAQPGQAPTSLTVDRDNIVIEGNEVNNDASLSLTVKTPAPGAKSDLVIQDPHFEPAQADKGQPFKAVMTAKNVGSVPAGSFAAQWHFHANLALQDCNWDIAQGLGPGASAKLSCTRTTNVQPGVAPTTLTIDRDNTVAESDEINNDAELMLTVKGPAASIKPDLVIQETRFDPAKPIGGQPFTAIGVVKNQGQGAAGTFKVAWKFNAGAEIEDCTWTVDGGLQPGATKSLSCSRARNGPPGSTVTSSVKVDSANAVDESNENNNMTSPNLTLDTAQVVNAPAGGLPDLVIKDLQLSPSTMKPAMDLTVNFKVVNDGNSPAGASKAEWKTPPGGNMSWTCDVPALFPGKSYMCSMSFMAGPTKIAIYGTTATADVGHVVTEEHEDNNQMKAVLTVKN